MKQYDLLKDIHTYEYALKNIKTLTMLIKYQLLLFILVLVRLFLCCPVSLPILMAHVLNVTLELGILTFARNVSFDVCSFPFWDPFKIIFGT